METEIKYSPVTLTLFNEICTALHLTEVQELSMYAAYYDTEQGEISQNKGAFRCRKENGRIIWTLKMHKLANRGLSQRYEHEVETQSMAEEIAVLLPYATEEIGACLKQTLHSVAVMEFLRREVYCRVGGGEIALSLDLGTMCGKSSTAPIAELELELKKGGVPDLLSLAERIEAQFHLKQDGVSKLQKALLL